MSSRDDMKDLPFPLAGVDEYRAVTRGRVFNGRTSAAMSQRAVNVRGVDPRSGRARGGMRSGLVRYIDERVNGDSSIQDIDVVTTSGLAPGVGIGQIAYPEPSGFSHGLATATGTSYYTGGETASGRTLQKACWDENGNCYIAAASGTGTNVLRVYAVDSSGNELWTSSDFSLGGDAIDEYGAAGLVAREGVVYLLIVRSTSPQGRLYRLHTTNGIIVDSGGTAWKTTSGGGLLGSFATAMVAAGNHLAVAGDTNIGVLATANSHFQVLNRFSGEAVSATDMVAFSLGYDLTSDDANYFYMLFNGANPRLMKVSAAGAIQWSVTISAECCAYDPINGVIAISRSTTDSVKVYSAAGTLLASDDPGSVTEWNCIRAAGDGGFVLWRTNATSNVMKIDSALADAWGPVTLGASVNDISSVAVNTGRGLAISPDIGVRSVRGLVVSGGTIRRFERSTGLVDITGGDTVLDPSRSTVFGAQNGEDFFYVDGVAYKRYDSAIDQVLDWTPTDGDLPIDPLGNRARLICTWRGRTLLTGLIHDPANWFMSAQGDPFNWDYSPATTLVTQAVAGNNSEAGKMGDKITCPIAYNDDLLVFGGDHTIWQMTGDPMEGGRLDLVTDTIGMTFGRPYCRSPAGVLYFMGSRGGAYQLVPGSLPKKITSDSIDERLSRMDFGLTVVRMAWDDRQQGFHVFLSSTDRDEETEHLFYDARNQAWWVDRFANAHHNPVAVAVLDGDAIDDRVVLLGGRDGYLRKLDPTADDDDGSGIDSFVYLGPLSNVMIKELQATLATDSGNVTWTLHVGESAEAALDASPVASGVLTGGRNRSHACRRFGHAAYFRLASQGAWAIEQFLYRSSPSTMGRGRRF